MHPPVPRRRLFSALLLALAVPAVWGMSPEFLLSLWGIQELGGSVECPKGDSVVSLAFAELHGKEVLRFWDLGDQPTGRALGKGQISVTVGQKGGRWGYVVGVFDLSQVFTPFEGTPPTVMTFIREVPVGNQSLLVDGMTPVAISLDWKKPDVGKLESSDPEVLMEVAEHSDRYLALLWKSFANQEAAAKFRAARVASRAAAKAGSRFPDLREDGGYGPDDKAPAAVATPAAPNGLKRKPWVQCEKNSADAVLTVSLSLPGRSVPNVKKVFLREAKPEDEGAYGKNSEIGSGCGVGVGSVFSISSEAREKDVELVVGLDSHSTDAKVALQVTIDAAYFVDKKDTIGGIAYEVIWARTGMRKETADKVGK
jgi:hypothetical protein